MINNFREPHNHGRVSSHQRETISLTAATPLLPYQVALNALYHLSDTDDICIITAYIHQARRHHLHKSNYFKVGLFFLLKLPEMNNISHHVPRVTIIYD